MKYDPATPIKKIKPYKGNPRVITAEATAAVAASIQEFGFLNPIVVDQDFCVLAGHNRLAAAKSLGMDTVPTLQTTMDEIKARGYRIASNKTGELAQWDRDELDKELAGIMQECESTIGAIGLQDWEIKRVMAQLEREAVEVSTKKESKPPAAAQQIPARPIDGIPQILRTVLILDKPADTPALLEMLGYERAEQIPSSLHASEAFKNV